MQSLKSIFDGPEPGDQNPPAPAHETRANRTAVRLAANRWSRRQRQALGIVFLGGFLALIIGLIWADRTGRLDVVSLKSKIWLENRLAAQGLAAPHVQVTGLTFTTHADIRSALGAYDLEPLSRIQPRQAVQGLEALPWVLEARVQRLWPNTINIWIQEKTPLAILHRADQTFLIDRRGQIITATDPDTAYTLPHISGNGAEATTPRLMETLKSFPDIERRLVAAMRVSERRWDLYLSPGVKVRLPANQTFEGLSKLQRLMIDHDILERDISALDLRGRRSVILR